MKKLMTIALLSLMTSGIFSQLALADITPDPIQPVRPTLIEARVYTGDVIMKMKNGNIQKGTATLMVERIADTNLFRVQLTICVEYDMGGMCMSSTWSYWMEGKVANGNWMIKDVYFTAVLGKKMGHGFIKSPYGIINMKLVLE